MRDSLGIYIYLFRVLAVPLALVAFILGLIAERLWIAAEWIANR